MQLPRRHQSLEKMPANIPSQRRCSGNIYVPLPAEIPKNGDIKMRFVKMKEFDSLEECASVAVAKGAPNDSPPTTTSNGLALAESTDDSQVLMIETSSKMTSSIISVNTMYGPRVFGSAVDCTLMTCTRNLRHWMRSN